MEQKSLSKSARKVQDALDEFGMKLQVLELPGSTRTAIDAAAAIGCQVGQIAKSLAFRTGDTSKPVLVIASGNNRVNEEGISAYIGEEIEQADAAFVRQATGFVIGGVPPVGHTSEIMTFIDEDLLTYNEIWAAAGTPRAVFRMTPNDLQRITSGKVILVK